MDAIFDPLKAGEILSLMSTSTAHANVFIVHTTVVHRSGAVPGSIKCIKFFDKLSDCKNDQMSCPN